MRYEFQYRRQADQQPNSREQRPPRPPRNRDPNDDANQTEQEADIRQGYHAAFRVMIAQGDRPNERTQVFTQDFRHRQDAGKWLGQLARLSMTQNAHRSGEGGRHEEKTCSSKWFRQGWNAP